MQQKDKASPCSIYEQFFRGMVLSARLCTHQSTYPDLHNLRVTTSIICWVLSALQGNVLYSSNIGSTLYSVMCQTIDSLEYRCTVKAVTHVSSPKSQINIFPHLFRVVPSHADTVVSVVFAKVLISLPVGFMLPPQCNESVWSEKWRIFSHFEN